MNCFGKQLLLLLLTCLLLPALGFGDMKSVDADKNGKITPEEAEAYHAKIAGRVDKDSDGFITIEELNPKE